MKHTRPPAGLGPACSPTRLLREAQTSATAAVRKIKVMTLHRLEKSQRGIVLALLLLLDVFLAWNFVQIWIQAEVNVQMGFDYATPELDQGEVFLIIKVVPGMPMDEGGLRRFDQVRFWDTGDLYRLILCNQGDTIAMPIKRDDLEMDVCVAVPPLHLSLPAKWYK